MNLPEQIDAEARKAGFARAGIAPVDAPNSERTAYLEEWIASGRAGEMEYLKRRNDQGSLLRSSLASALPWARSVIVCATPYDADEPLSIEPASPRAGWIARYAWSGGPSERPSDYHKVLVRRLRALEAALHDSIPEPFTSRAWVDTGPLIERSYAHAAGIGWTAKNTCTLSESLGSFFFLGVIATSLECELRPRAALPPDRCGSCTRCLDACPTGALPAPYQMDASRCISYLTIEKRGAIPPDLRAGVGRQIFGCDICQDVCPWNGRARRRSFASVPAKEPDADLAPRRQLINPDLGVLGAMSEEEYAQSFHGSPVHRAKFQGFRRNIAIAMGNSGLTEFLEQLERWVNDPDPVLAEAATWAVERIVTASAPAVATDDRSS